LEKWNTKNPVKIGHDLHLMALDILGLCIFGKDFNSFNGSLDGPLQSYQYVSANIMDILSVFIPIIAKLPLQKYKKLDLEIDKFNTFLNDYITKSRAEYKETKIDGGPVKKTLLDLLILANETETDKVSDQVIRDNAVIFFIAGHESTYSSMMYEIYELGKNQDIQDRARKEVDEFFDKYGDNFDYQSFQDNLDYITCIMKEALRLHPPAPAIGARCTENDTVLGDYWIPKGTIIQPNLYAIQLSEEYFDDPETFDPGRFSPERKHKLQKSSFLAFSTGPRVCIGQNFAMLAQKILLTLLLRKFTWKLAPNTVLKNPKIIPILIPDENLLQVLFSPR